MENISVVLVEPQGPLNIGSVCRVMMNFGLSKLRLVKPCIDYNGIKSRRMALKSVDILNRVQIFDDLSEAISDCNLVFGTTRRIGKRRLENPFFYPDEAAKHIFTKVGMVHIAYVFGREDVGLHNDELEKCNFYITISTDSAYSSMNLSHAVSICIYELRKIFLNGSKKDNFSKALVNSKNMENMINHMRKTLFDIGYLNFQNPDHIVRSLRSILNRSGLNNREVRILQGLWSRIDWINKKAKE